MKKVSAGRQKMLHIGVALASAVALTAAMAPAALAATSESEYVTNVKLFKDTGQVEVDVPMNIPAVIQQNGEFLASDQIKFVNKSFYPVHVAKVGVKTSSDVTLKSQAEFATDDVTKSLVWATVTPSNGAPLDLSKHTTTAAPANLGQWTIQKEGELPIALNGAMKNPADLFNAIYDSSNAPTAFTVTWVIAYGAPTVA